MSKTVAIVNNHRLNFKNAVQAAMIELSCNFQLEYYNSEEHRPVTDYVLTAKGVISYGSSFEDEPMSFTELYSMLEFDFLQYLEYPKVAKHCRDLIFKFLEITYEESTKGSVRRRHNITTIIRGGSAEEDVEFMLGYLRPVVDSVAAKAKLLTEGETLLVRAVANGSNHVCIVYGDIPAFLRGEDQGVRWLIVDTGMDGYRLSAAKFVPKRLEKALRRALDETLEANPLLEKHVYMSLDDAMVAMRRADAILDNL